MKNGWIPFLFSGAAYNNIQSKIRQNTTFQKYKEYLSDTKEYIVHGSFIATVAFIIISLFFDTGILLQLSVIFFYIIFFIAKLLGFTLNYTIFKSAISNGNTLRFFLISLWGFIVIVTLILNSFGIPQVQRSWWYLLLWGVYTVLWAGIFFTWNLKFPRLFTTYNILSMFLISCLLGFLAFQNWFLNLNRAPENLEQENGQESVWSDDFFEAEVWEQIWDNIDNWETQENQENIQNTAQEETEIIFETRQVAEEYTLNPGIQLWSSGENVRNLQLVLWQLQYYTGEINGEFDETTQAALSNTLKWECSWPESTRWIFWPQAKACIDSLSISIAVN